MAFQRSDYKKNWQSPEGGSEDSETPKQALIRELYEEIGIKEEQYNILKETDFIEYLFPKIFISNIKKKYNVDGQSKKF